MDKKPKILVAMSGGVDSSVAAALLVRAGFDVTGMFAVNYDEPRADGESCWHGDYEDALRVCAKLGIKLLRWNFVKEYRRDVLNYMYREYSAGRTPNPDVLCNKFVKFGAWLKRAKKEGFDYLATGHYARLTPRISNFKFSNCRLAAGISKQFQNSNFQLIQAKDNNKDQTYFLHQLSQDQLKHALFPIGEYTKSAVRALAKKFKLPTAEKEESMGICFVGEVPMRKFLEKKIKPRPGETLLSDGTIIGKHDGLPFYTIGERKAIKSKPYFVVDKNLKNNQLIVGLENDPRMFKKEIIVKNIHWISDYAPKLPLKCQFRLRHRQDLQKGVISKDPIPNTLKLRADSPQRAVTPGQFAVLYSARRSPKGAKAGKNGDCLGGGVIL